MATKKATKPKVTKRATRTRRKYTYAVGRRKAATAQVRLFKGKGETLVNKKPIAEYFPGQLAETAYQQPFQVTSTEGKYYATIHVRGSGKKSQLLAVVHGLARALDKENQDRHSELKKNGLLTRDSRARERRKMGQMGRARKKKQSPKR